MAPNQAHDPGQSCAEGSDSGFDSSGLNLVPRPTVESVSLVGSGGSPTNGSHVAKVYDAYLDSSYDREKFADELAEYLAFRSVRSVLDCAAGTGFPALDLTRRGFDVTCTDASAAMIRQLRINAARQAVDPTGLEPKRSSQAGSDPMLLGWDDLDDLVDQYDYVMCRGNSLVYHGSWDGGPGVAQPAAVARSIATIGRRVAIGGYLHLDGPREADGFGHGRHQDVRATGAAIVDETVAATAEKRAWHLRLSLPNGNGHSDFETTLFSSRLTVDELVGLVTDPVFSLHDRDPLRCERLIFGVAILQREGETSG